MGRRRKNEACGLEPRVYQRHGAYYYVHRNGKWQHLGQDKDAANRKAKVLNDPAGDFGTVVYWMDRFLIDCEQRVRDGTLAQRTLDDYRNGIEISTKRDGSESERTGWLRRYFAPPMTPLDVTPSHIQRFLELGAQAGRSTQANREKACFSAVMSWLLRTSQVPGLIVNPCLRASGTRRNPEAKRERYVTHEEFRDVWAKAPKSVRVLLELTYRSLQRPESDIIGWTTVNVITDSDGRRKLSFVQNKTKRPHLIALTPELEEMIPRPVGSVLKLREPLVKRLDGEPYTYDGISAMLKRAIAAANRERAKAGRPKIQSFGFRDLKGKGATDMYFISKVPIEQIQQLLGHANKATTEIYIKQRWKETSEPNLVQWRS